MHKLSWILKFRFYENCPREKLPPPNSNTNPKPNPDPDRVAIFLGCTFPDTLNFTFLIKVINRLSCAKNQDRNCFERVGDELYENEMAYELDSITFTWNYANIDHHYEKIKIPHLNSEFLSALKNSETEVSVKQFLKNTPRLQEETIYSGNLYHLPLRMLKLCLAIVDNFNWQFSSSGNHSGRHFL